MTTHATRDPVDRAPLPEETLWLMPWEMVRQVTDAWVGLIRLTAFGPFGWPAMARFAIWPWSLWRWSEPLPTNPAHTPVVHQPFTVVHHGTDLEITAPLEGIEPDEIDVRVEGDALIIHAEQVPVEGQGKDPREEPHYHRFHHAIPLPPGIRAEGVHTQFTDTHLHVRVTGTPTTPGETAPARPVTVTRKAAPRKPAARVGAEVLVPTAKETAREAVPPPTPAMPAHANTH